MSGGFNQGEYWVRRHRDLVGDPRSVGNLAASLEDSVQGDIDFQNSIRETASIIANGRALSVLDLGCGYGRIASSYMDEGYTYTGVDISPEAVETARKTYPGTEFIQADLAEYTTRKKYDVVCVLYVFVHFVDDAAWQKFLKMALGAVKKGGVFFFADVFPQERKKHGDHVVSRPLSEYLGPLEAAGLKLDPALKAEVDRRVNRFAPHYQFARKA